MEPLDLSKRPPRGPREKMLGLYFLPRTIDKLRAFLPGGDPGAYFVTDRHGMSAYLLRKIEIDPAALGVIVAAAADEAAVEAWIAAHAELSDVEALNQRMSSVTIGMLDAERLGTMRDHYAGIDDRPKTETIFAFIEFDDAALAASGSRV